MKTAFTLIISLFFLVGCASTKQATNGTIYKTDKNKVLIDRMYDSKLARWPVPYQIIEVKTKYGSTNIIASGDAANPPVFLIHAMGINATMWLPTVSDLSKSFRVYAINTIGDLGKSELNNIEKYPRNGWETTDWLNEIVEKLKIEKLDIIGSSMGGWISLNYAIYSPEKVKHLILIGPMGLKANTFGVMKRLMKLTINPSEKNKKALIKWVLGNNEKTRYEITDYMNIAMNCQGRMPMPKNIKRKELNRITAKTLLLLGENDNALGNPGRNARFARKSIRNIEVTTLLTGHLISIEEPEAVNSMILDFLKK